MSRHLVNQNQPLHKLNTSPPQAPKAKIKDRHISAITAPSPAA
ncbi:hypothetical protein SeseC_00768 [Streptococcus equi subsp. zooepidemicus ATCC 35246]|nr:hypothetical protein SeseC_00768 [Streptococcus equi subsp. zooepidemicus ATCC 35246]